MKRILGMVVVGLLAVGLAACGGSSSGPAADDSLTISSIEQLPKATGAMAASASASLSVKSVEDGEPTGINFSTIIGSSFVSGSSMAGCEMFNSLKSAFSAAAQADTILCYVGQMSESFDGLTEVDPYDGDYHVYDLNITGDEEEGGSPSKVKMKISKDSDGNINLFEMFACSGSEAGDQIEYVKQEIIYATGVVDMEARGLHADSSSTGSHSISVDGTLNADRAFTDRTIVVEDTYNDTGSDNAGESKATLVQDTDNPEFTFSGFQVGTWDNGSYQTQVFAVGNLVHDDSSELSDLAMGDGAVNVDMESISGEGDWTPAPFVDAWSGVAGPPAAPQVADSASDFYDAAVAGTVATVVDVSDVTFTAGSDDYWDCTDTADGEVSGTASDMAAACETIDHNWINCYDLLGDEFEE